MPFLRRPRLRATAVRRVAAGLLAVAALVLALRPPPPAGGRPAATAPVVVAVTDLGPGAVLRPGDLRTRRFPVPLVPAGAGRDPAAMSGRVLAAGIRAGEPLTDVRLVGGGLTALLPAGQVAAAVRPADLAVTGLVRPGDRVDVLAATGGGGASAEPVAEAVLVLAVPRSGTASGAATADRNDGAAAGLLVLAVDRATAARLAAAAAGATLTVTLTPP